MRLVFFVLNKTEKLDDLLSEFGRRNICGATVVESKGMARLLSQRYDDDEIPILGSLRQYLNPERTRNFLILIVVPADRLQEVVGTIESVVGDLSEKDTGIIFSVPVDFTKGICDIGQ